ncbi:conjugal transfer protein TraF [Candidatus Woesearchaeota archaeon]|nr:conjugal transfer protein TraF [Candidatus Woesearchaeota archaeon]
MKRKKISIQKTTIVLLLTIVIFSSGVLIGNHNTNKKFLNIVELGDELRLETLGIEVEYDILAENICENEEALFLTTELFDLAEKLDFMENELGSNSDQVIQLKKQYFILEARHWMLAKNRLENCLENDKGINNTVVLYFYSNQGDCPRCQQQGAVLTYLHKKYPGMKVYSFDINIDSPVVNVLKQLYDITTTPGLVINDETHEGYMDADTFITFVTNQQKTQVSQNIMEQIV